jgi:hypothetical protein
MANNLAWSTAPTFRLSVLILAIVQSFSTSFAAEISLLDKVKDEGKLVAYLAMNAADAVTVQTSFEKKYPQITPVQIRT